MENKQDTHTLLLREIIQTIYDKHKDKLLAMKENRSKAFEEKWSNAEISSVDSISSRRYL